LIALSALGVTVAENQGFKKAMPQYTESKSSVVFWRGVVSEKKLKIAALLVAAALDSATATPTMVPIA
jgi:hypothetical protein